MALKGSAVLIKKGTSASGTAIAGLRTHTLTLNSETVDVTTADNTNRWRELLAATGIKTMSISGSGVLAESATHSTLVSDFIAQTADAYGVVLSTLGTFNGNFQLTQFESNGEYNGEENYSITLESAGDITWATA